MTSLLSVQDTIRANGYSFDGWLNTPSREMVLEGTVTANATEPLFTISYTGTGGDYTDVQPHMEIEVFSSTGKSKGRLRAALGPVTSNSLPVNETSKGRIKVVAGDTFVVMREWRLRDLLVGATDAFPKDSRVAYTDQNADVAPLPLTGGHWAGKVDDGEDYATVPFFGTLSRSVGAKTYLWDVQDGTIITGSSTTGDIVVRFPVGKRWIDFTVTDANGAFSTQHLCVIVEDAAAPGLPCALEGVGGTRQDGWRVSFQLPIHAQRTIDAMPDGQMILYHEDEYREGAVLSYGSPIAGRSRLKFVGFLVRNSIEIDPAHGIVTFEAVSPMALLSQLLGFSQALFDVASANWQTYPDLTVLAAILYLIVWHTTLPVLFDLDVSGVIDRPFPELFVQQNIVYQQIMELVAGLSSEFVCDRTGRFYIARKLKRASSTARNAADTLIRLGVSDIAEIRLAWEHRYKSAQMEGKGFTQGANGQPVLSVAPGEAPAEAPAITNVDRLIVESQAELNAITGWSYAEENSLMNGAPVPPALEITLRGGYDVGDFQPGQWILLDIPADFDPRGIGYDDARMILDAIQINYDGAGGKEVVWTCSHETDGEEGTTRTPNDNTAIPPEYFPPVYQPPVIDPGDGSNLSKGKPDIVCFGDDNMAYRTSTADHPSASGGPAWDDNIDLETLTNFPSGATLCQAEYNPHEDPPGGVLLYDTAFQTIADSGAATPTLSSAYSFGNSTTACAVATSRWIKDAIWIVRYIPNVGTWGYVSDDYGATVVDVEISDEYDADPTLLPCPGIEVVPGANYVIVTAYGAGGTTQAYKLYLDGTVTTHTDPAVTPGALLAGGIATYAQGNGANAYYGARDGSVGGTPGGSPPTTWSRVFTFNPTNGLMGWTLNFGSVTGSGIQTNATFLFKAEIELSFTVPAGCTLTTVTFMPCYTIAANRHAYVNAFGNFIAYSNAPTGGEILFPSNCTGTIGSSSLSITNQTGTITLTITDNQAPNNGYIQTVILAGTGPDPFAGGGALHLMRNAVDISPVDTDQYGLDVMGAAMHRLAVADDDANTLLAVVVDTYDAGRKSGVVATRAATAISAPGSPQMTFIDPPATGDDRWEIVYGVGRNTFYLGGYGDKAFGFWDGSRIDNRTGDMALGAHRIVGLWGL